MLIPALGALRARHVQVRARPGVHRRAAHAAQARPGLDRAGVGARRAGRPARRRRRRAARPGDARRAHDRRTCAGTWVTGTGIDGEPRSTYLYHVVDNETTMREYGTQAVVWQTAVNPVGRAGAARPRGPGGAAGVLGPEAFPPRRSWSAWRSWGSRTGRCELPAPLRRQRAAERASRPASSMSSAGAVRRSGLALAREVVAEEWSRDEHDDDAEQHAADAHPERQRDAEDRLGRRRFRRGRSRTPP